MAADPADAPFSPVADPVSRSDLIVDAIRSAILSGKLPAGQPLVERDLAAMLGVSKTPIREALKVLSRSGLVTTVSFRGAAVREVDRELIDSIYEVRLLVEPVAIQHSIKRHDDESLQMAAATLHHARAAAEADNFVELSACNRLFHKQLYSRCQNQLMISILDQVQDLVALISTHFWRRRATWSHEAAEHEDVLHAVEIGDEDRAYELVRRHVASSLERILQALDDADHATSRLRVTS
jgi:DNA-binding GntR family transcriptional regulator